MRRLSLFLGSLAVITLSGLIATCTDPESRTPPSPTPPGASTVEIGGPDTVAPSRSVQFTATTMLADGTNKVVTGGTGVRWRTSNSQVLQVSTGGVAAGQAKGEATLTVELTLPAGGPLRRSSKEIVVLPDGTYRVVGAITEAGSPFPISGARVEAQPGSVTTTTDSNGQYRLYGVPPDAIIRVTSDGYLPYEQSVHLAAHTTQNLQMALSGPRLDLAGNYTLAIDTVAPCSSLPADLQHRRYDAVVTQAGSELRVMLTEPRFAVNSLGRGNQFTGRVTGNGATFTLQLGLLYYYYYSYFYGGPTNFPDVVELLPNASFLVMQGSAVTTGSAAGLSGQLNGGITNYGVGFPKTVRYLGSCFSGPRLTLTPR